MAVSALDSTAAPALPVLRWLPALTVVAAVGWLGLRLEGETGGRNLVLSLWLGAFFGVFLQRSRFCFYCVSRDFLERRDARGLLGLMAALAVGTLGYHALFGAFLAEPVPGRLPPGAHIGPVSWVLALAAFGFGLGMAIAGSCISAQLYRLGEGWLAAPLALLGAAAGFVLGFLSWNPLYLLSMQQAPVVWLPHHLGYGGSLLLQLALIGALAFCLYRLHRSGPAATGSWWSRRWQPHTGGILIGALAVIAYLRVAPLGVTAELGSIARTVADNGAWLPARLEGLDTLRGCVTAVKESLWSNNGAFIAGLVPGALAAALFAGDFRLQLPSAGEALRALGGGLLMGWGAMLALGCTVGTLLSGIMAAALSGWVFALFAGAGLWAGWRLRQRFPTG